MDFEAAAFEGACLYVPVVEVEGPVGNAEDIGTDDDERAGNESAVPEEDASPAERVKGVVGSLAALGAGGDADDPESSPRNTRIKAMPTRPAIPIPFCRSRTVKT